MEKSERKSRAKYPRRVHIQVSDELAAVIDVVAEREYGGSVPELGRQALAAFLDPNGAGRAAMAGVPEALERMEALLHSVYDTVSPHDTVLITLQEEMAKLSMKIQGLSNDDEVLREVVRDLRPLLSGLTEAVAELPYRGSSQ